MYWSISPDNSLVPWALSHTRLVSIDFARIIRHYNEDELPSDTINDAKDILDHHLELLMVLCSEMDLGTNVRRQGQCTTIQLACFVD